MPQLPTKMPEERSDVPAIEGDMPMSPKRRGLFLDRIARRGAEYDASSAYHLTDRERQILDLLAEGLIQKEIALELGISFHTVVTHMRKLYKKLHVTTNTGAVAKAIREKLIGT